MFMAEITNICLTTADQLNFHMMFPDFKSALQILFMFTFIVVRIYLGYPYILMIQSSGASFFYIIGPTTVWVLSMHWIWAMGNKFSKFMHQVKQVIIVDLQQHHHRLILRICCEN